MNEQTRKHLDEVNGNAKDLVAVVQYEETKDVLSLLDLGEKPVILTDGVGTVTYKGKDYKVEVDIEDVGDLPDEEVFDGFESYMVGNITYSRPKFKKVEGRTVVDAVIYLTVNGKNCVQEDYYRGKGSHVHCEDGTILWRYAFVVPVRTFTGKGKSKPDD